MVGKYVFFRYFLFQVQSGTITKYQPDFRPTMTNSENRPFLTIKEVSKLIGLSVSTINRLVKKGDFPLKVKISPRRIVFMKKEIDVWIENQRNN